MVFKKLIFCICSIFGPRGWRRIKVSSLLEVIHNITEPNSCNNNPDKVVISEGSRLEENNEGFDPNDQDEMEKICCVCLSRLDKGEDKRLLPCSHEFHRECVDRWLKNGCRRTCPVCRLLMEDGDEKTMKREFLTEEMMVWFSSFHVAGFWSWWACMVLYMVARLKKINYINFCSGLCFRLYFVLGM